MKVQRFEIPSRGVALEIKDTHPNIFMVREIKDQTEHGNLGLFSVAWFDKTNWFYNVPLLEITTGSNLVPWIEQGWKEFCEEKKIRKWKNSDWRTTQYPRNEADTEYFAKWLQSKYKTSNHTI